MPDRFTSVIFDLGGVLIDWNPRYLYRKLLDSEEEVEHFLSTVCTPEWNARQDAGRPFAEGVAQLSRRHPEHAGLIEAYHTRWIEMIGGAIEGTVAIMTELRHSGMPLYALTNWSAETFPLVRPRFEFLDWFEGIVVSGVEKQIKPNTSFYQVLLNRYDIDPGETMFIDDSKPNVEAARTLGIHAVHFESPDQTRAHMDTLGLL